MSRPVQRLPVGFGGLALAAAMTVLGAQTRTHSSESTPLHVVFNSSARRAETTIDTGAIHASLYRDLESGAVTDIRKNKLAFELPGYGHRIFRAEP